MISPPSTSEDQSPLLQEPREAFETSFADIAQKPSPSVDFDEDEDELSIHVDNALAATSTADLGLPDVMKEHREHANVSGGEHDVVAQGSDWMDYELTG